MAKRFADTNKYRKSFIRGLNAPYKLLWDFICLECDFAGFWNVDFEVAQICIGKDAPINEQEALAAFNKDEERIIVIKNGKKWFIPSFIEFQYGVLSPDNRAHNAVIQMIEKERVDGACKALKTPYQGGKDKDKDKDSLLSSKNINEMEKVKAIISYLNQKTNASYRFTSEKTKILIRARLAEGFTVDDFMAVIDKKAATWLNDPKMCKYLRPETLFSPKFEGYLNEKISLSDQGKVSVKTERTIAAGKKFMEGEDAQ